MRLATDKPLVKTFNPQAKVSSLTGLCLDWFGFSGELTFRPRTVCLLQTQKVCLHNSLCRETFGVCISAAIGGVSSGAGSGGDEGLLRGKGFSPLPPPAYEPFLSRREKQNSTQPIVLIRHEWET